MSSGERKAERNRVSGRIVVLADDFTDVREMYGTYLRMFGVTVEEVACGRLAIEKTRALRPDVVFMDLSMPDIDGWAATSILKADPATSVIPVVVLSAHAFLIERDRARAAGCDGYIAKPCLPEDLLVELGRFPRRAVRDRLLRAAVG